MSKRSNWIRFFCWMTLFIGLSSSATETVPENHSQWSFRVMGQIPIQNGGRIKPFDSFARELVLFETGSRRFEGWNSVDLLLSWIAHPDYWGNQNIIRITREDVKRQLGLPEKRTLFSPQELVKNSSLAQYAERMGHGAQGMESPPGAPKTGPREQELKAVLERIQVFHGLITGQAWLLIPKPVPAAWESILDTSAETSAIRNPFVELLKSYQADQQNEFERNAELLKAAIAGEIPGYQENHHSKIQAEVFYNRTRPFLYAWIIYLVAGALWAFAGASRSVDRQTRLKTMALSTTLVAAGVQIVGIALRCFVAGRPPVTNMYESVIWVSLGVVLFAGVIYYLHRQTMVLAVACILAMFGLVAGDSAPAILDSSLNPLVPVLRSNYWLTIHVLTITLGYAAFALSLGLANITLFQFAKRAKAAQINLSNQLNYRAIQFGVVFIAAGTILGGIWADYSWGRFWGWDPKEVWALITLLCYLVILHGRYANWVGQFGFAIWSAVSFLSVVMAWYGVNFILGVGLHSYGFSTGGTPWVLGFVGLQMAYILGVTAIHLRNSALLAKGKLALR